MDGTDSVRRSCVRESSSRSRTPKGTAARLLRPVPGTLRAGVPGSMHEGGDRDRQWSLRHTAGLPRDRTGRPGVEPVWTNPQRTGRLGRHRTDASAEPRPRARRRARARGAPPGRRHRPGPLGGLQLPAGPGRAAVVRQLARRRRRHRPGPRGRHRRLPTAAAPLGAVRAVRCRRAPGRAALPEKTHRSADRFPHPRPHLFSQLPAMAHYLSEPPPNPRSTCTERVSEALCALRGLATDTRRTSLRRPGVQRFVIECFTPSCHVDNVPSAEPATSAPRDTVDSILTVYGGGLVQDRGETCWSDRPEGTRAPRPPRGA
ncbi:hypothetical protein SFUMM280S_05698 [Streptomyces fumanus]